MTDSATPPLPSDTPQIVSETSLDGELLPMGRKPRFARRDLAIGGAGLALGILLGTGGIGLASLLTSGVTSLISPERMTAASEECGTTGNAWITVGDDGTSITMKSAGEESSGASMTDIACVLDQLDTPDSVISRIDATRALDGRQSATWSSLTASWGYHPDDGLNMVIEPSGE